MQIWLRRSLTAWLLWPLSLLFRAVVALRKALYACGILKSTHLPVPVIIVGNIFIGGTGKTPFVIWLVEVLRQNGFTPGVISRGYGSSSDRPIPVNADARPENVGDEPVLIFQRTQCPLWVGRKRAATGQALLATHPEVNVIISDDGLQHYALQRDIEIVMSDGRGNGNGFMLPAGPLREPTSRRRDFTIVNSPTDFTPAKNTYAMHLIGERAESLADRSHRIALASISSGEKKLAAAAGIGNPRRFFSLLQSAGLTFTEIPLPDHFDYKTNPFLNFDAEIILITEKDAVKCSFVDSFQNGQLWVVPVDAQIDAALIEQIVEQLHANRTS